MIDIRCPHCDRYRVRCLPDDTWQCPDCDWDDLRRARNRTHIEQARARLHANEYRHRKANT